MAASRRLDAHRRGGVGEGADVGLRDAELLGDADRVDELVDRPWPAACGAGSPTGPLVSTPVRRPAAWSRSRVASASGCRLAPSMVWFLASVYAAKSSSSRSCHGSRASASRWRRYCAEVDLAVQHRLVVPLEGRVVALPQRRQVDARQPGPDEPRDDLPRLLLHAGVVRERVVEVQDDRAQRHRESGYARTADVASSGTASITSARRPSSARIVRSTSGGRPVQALTAMPGDLEPVRPRGAQRQRDGVEGARLRPRHDHQRQPQRSRHARDGLAVVELVEQAARRLDDDAVGLRRSRSTASTTCAARAGAARSSRAAAAGGSGAW